MSVLNLSFLWSSLYWKLVGLSTPDVLPAVAAAVNCMGVSSLYQITKQQTRLIPRHLLHYYPMNALVVAKIRVIPRDVLLLTYGNIARINKSKSVASHLNKLHINVLLFSTKIIYFGTILCLLLLCFD